MSILGRVWSIFQDQILGMAWLNALIGRGLSGIGIDVGSRMGGSVQFFLYDTIKILVLLAVLIYVISYIQCYFPPERTKRILSRFDGILANTVAALLGTVTPFCSCSSIPLFIGFSRAGLSLGVMFSFLISSPLVDLGSLVLLMSIFGWKIAVAYVVVGLVLAVLGGALIEKLGMAKYMESFVMAGEGVALEDRLMSRREKCAYAAAQVRSTVATVLPYILIGVGIGAVIHNWVPGMWVEQVLGGDNPFSVILATVIGVPMYADIFGTIPVAESLLSKGAGLGTILSFMMAVTALSLPSMILLRKVVKLKLLLVFAAIVSGGIILIGYLFNVFHVWFI